MATPSSDKTWKQTNLYVLPDRLVYDMAEWMYRVDFHYCPDQPAKQGLQAAHSTFGAPSEVYDKDIEQAMQLAARLQLCNYRLFNMVSCCPRGCQDLPALFDMISEPEAGQKKHFRHQEFSSLAAYHCRPY